MKWLKLACICAFRPKMLKETWRMKMMTTCCCRPADGHMSRTKRMRRDNMADPTTRLSPVFCTRTCWCLTERMTPVKRKETTLSPVSPPVHVLLENVSSNISPFVGFPQMLWTLNATFLWFLLSLQWCSLSFPVPLCKTCGCFVSRQPYICQRAAATPTGRWMCDPRLPGELRRRPGWAWSRMRAWCPTKGRDMNTWRTATSGTTFPHF